MDKMNKLWDSIRTRLKSLWGKAKNKLIEILGGYTFPPATPEIKAESITTVPVSASMMVDKYRYDTDRLYREYVRDEVARLIAYQAIVNGAVSNETVVELNDNEYIVKVSAKLVKGGD